MATITIKNYERLQSKLTKLSDADITSVVRSATVFVHGQAKILAPVDKGQLRTSIHMEVKSIDGGSVQGRVYTNSDHASFVEFGTGRRGDGSYPYQPKDIELAYKQDWPGMVSQPYLMPALKGSEKYVEHLINKGLQRKIDSIVGGGK